MHLNGFNVKAVRGRNIYLPFIIQLVILPVYYLQEALTDNYLYYLQLLL